MRTGIVPARRPTSSHSLKPWDSLTALRMYVLLAAQLSPARRQPLRELSAFIALLMQPPIAQRRCASDAPAGGAGFAADPRPGRAAGSYTGSRYAR